MMFVSDYLLRPKFVRFMNWRITNGNLRVRLSNADVEALDLHREVTMSWHGEFPFVFGIQLTHDAKEGIHGSEGSWLLCVDDHRWSQLDKSPGRSFELALDNNAGMDGLRIFIEIDLKQKQ